MSQAHKMRIVNYLFFYNKHIPVLASQSLSVLSDEEVSKVDDPYTNWTDMTE